MPELTRDALLALRDGATPGPWNAETVRTSCGVCHKVGPWPHKWRAGETMHACIYDDYPSPPEGTDVMLANARFIAAAPDLAATALAAMDERDALRAQLAAARAETWKAAREAVRGKLGWGIACDYDHGFVEGLHEAIKEIGRAEEIALRAKAKEARDDAR